MMVRASGLGKGGPMGASRTGIIVNESPAQMDSLPLPFEDPSRRRSQTRAFILHPVERRLPGKPIVGAAAVHRVLAGRRQRLHGQTRDDALAAR
jgi:hypothetical protein